MMLKATMNFVHFLDESNELKSQQGPPQVALQLLTIF